MGFNSGFKGLKSDKNIGYLTRSPECVQTGICTVYYLAPLLLRVRYVSDRSCKEFKTDISRSAAFFFENSAAYEIM